MLRDIVTNQKKLFVPGAHTELRTEKIRTRRVSSVMGNLMGNGRSEEEGVCARVYKNGIYGFSSMAEISDDAAKAVLDADPQLVADKADLEDETVEDVRAILSKEFEPEEEDDIDDADVDETTDDSENNEEGTNNTESE